MLADVVDRKLGEREGVAVGIGQKALTYRHSLNLHLQVQLGIGVSLILTLINDCQLPAFGSPIWVISFLVF